MDHLVHYLKIIVPSLITSVLYSLFLLMIGGLDYTKLEYMSYDELASYFLDLMSIFILVIFIFSLISILIQCWTISMCSSAVKNEDFSLMDSLKKSLKYFLKALGVYAIQFAIWFAFFIGIIFILSIFTISISVTNNSPLAISIVLFIIFLILGVFFAVTLYPITYILINDDLDIGESFSKGFKFGVKNFINIFGAFAFIFVISFFLLILFSVPSIIQNEPPGIIVNIIWYILPLFFSIVTGIYILKLYNSQKNDSNTNQTMQSGISSTNDTIIDNEVNNEPLDDKEKEPDSNNN